MSTGSDSQTITFTTSEQDYSPANVSDIYGTMVFDERVMKERLPKATYKSSCAPSTMANRSTWKLPT